MKWNRKVKMKMNSMKKVSLTRKWMRKSLRMEV